MKAEKWEIFLLIFSAIVFLDRILKNYLENSCLSIFCIKRAMNSGAAFGLFSGQTLLFIIVSVVVLIIIAYLWKIRGIRLPLTLLAAGTAGNLIDRLAYGKIIDLFSIAGSSSFNLSDLSNLAGAVLIIIFILGKKAKSK
jgi:signal peptidase II